MNVEHTHDGDHLTFGCPACIWLVKEDRKMDELAERFEEAPRRNVKFTVRFEPLRGTQTVSLEVPDDATDEEIRQYHAEEIEAVIEDILLDNWSGMVAESMRIEVQQ